MSQVELDSSSELNLEVSFTKALCTIVDTPHSKRVKGWLENEQWDAIVNSTLDSADYEDHQHFADDYLVSEVLRKSPNLPYADANERAEAALGAFWASELQCYYTNERLSEKKPSWFSSLVQTVYDILGPLGHRELEFIEKSFDFGPGATTGVRGTGSVKSDKISAEMHLTANLIPYVRAMLGDECADYHSELTIVRGNKFTTVPKNAKTDRGICIEPTLNIFGQKGVGSLLRRKLRRFGVNLNDQTTNQKLASDAYYDKLATIDLSSASDSVCWSLVYLLLPPRWYEVLELFRSPTTKVGGKEPWQLEKFSSMGNGFTFELESLIFYALVCTVVPPELRRFCNVYGDDIIIPAEYADELVGRLKYLGFKTNSSKSFLAGNFFESCGTDWFKGQNVRPFYLKGSKDKIPYALQIANKLRLYASMRTNGLWCDSRFYPLYQALKACIPYPWNATRVPAAMGDVGLIWSYDESLQLPRDKAGTEQRIGCRVLTRPITRNKGDWSVLTAALLGLSKMDPLEWDWELVPSGTKPIPYRTPISFESRSNRDQLIRLALSVQKVSTIASYGREPVRGYLRKPKSKRCPMLWVPDGLSWLI